jgi:hypothetical protein
MLYCNVLNDEILTAPRSLPSEISEDVAVQNGWYPTYFSNLPHHIEPSCNKVTQIIKLTLEISGFTVIGTHIIENKFQSDIEATEVLLMAVTREERNKKLLMTDWTQLPNAAGLTQPQKDEWEVYRQSLREFPETVDLSNIVWPTPP